MTSRAILTGFMGAGKSTSGRAAAEVLDFDYCDTDDWLEESGIDIPSLLKKDADAFRRLEAEALETIIGQCEGGVIISTGGGIVSTLIGRTALLDIDAPKIWLDVPFDDVAERVRSDTGRQRPLFQDVHAARQLYDQRQEWYKETADFIVDASQPTDQVVRDIVGVLCAPALTN